MSSSLPPIVEAINLHKAYQKDARQIEVLKGVEFRLEAQDQVVLLGSSGAGKSTLLHLLGGLDRPTAGSVLINGEDLSKKSEADLAVFRNRFLGFIFQFHHLLPLFSALENVMMPCRIAGFSLAEAKKKAEPLLQEVGLADRMTHRPQELSGGEQQRVALARALVLDPKIVMADEPTGNLDSENSKKVFLQLLEMNRDRKTTLIVVTHNPELTAQFRKKFRVSDGKLFKE